MDKPPAVSPQKAEIQEIQALLDMPSKIIDVLESDAYGSAEEMAKAVLGARDGTARAIVAKAYELLLRRDWYAIVWEPEPGYVPTTYLTYGFWSTPGGAEKALLAPEKLGMGGGRARVLPVRSLASRLEWIEERLDVVKISTVCQNCKHQEAAHTFPHRRGTCVGQGCDCRQYVQTA